MRVIYRKIRHARYLYIKRNVEKVWGARYKSGERYLSKNTVVLWDVYCVNGCWSSRLGYVGVGFEGNCDCRYGILYAPMLRGGYVGYSGILSFFFGASVPGGGWSASHLRINPYRTNVENRVSS